MGYFDTLYMARAQQRLDYLRSTQKRHRRKRHILSQMKLFAKGRQRQTPRFL